MKPGPFADVLFTLAGLSFAWGLVSMVLVLRQWRKTGMTPGGRYKVLSGTRPSDPDELLMWRATLHMCCSLLIGVLCILVLVFGP